jgi:hypothetical protein
VDSTIAILLILGLVIGLPTVLGMAFGIVDGILGRVVVALDRTLATDARAASFATARSVMHFEVPATMRDVGTSLKPRISGDFELARAGDGYGVIRIVPRETGESFVATLSGDERDGSTSGSLRFKVLDFTLRGRPERVTNMLVLRSVLERVIADLGGTTRIDEQSRKAPFALAGIDSEL